MARNIYINLNAQSPRAAFVTSQVYPTQIAEMFALVLGDQPVFNIYLVDGAGNFDSTSGLTGYSLRMGIGPIPGSEAAYQDSFTQITSGWTGTIALNTAGMIALMNGQESRRAFLEIEVTDPSGNRQTYGQQDIELRNQVISAASVVPTPQPQFFSQTESLERFVQNRSAITGLIGGTATDLDGITTLGVPLGWVVSVVIGGYLSLYKLISGTTATSSPDTIRPADYATGTNERIWTLLVPSIVGDYVQNRKTLTGLTGGGALNLDGLATVGVSVGLVVALVVSDALYHYQLRSGTHAEDSPNFIRPDDYAAGTNEKYWQMRSGPALIVGADPNFLGKEGAYDWQPAFDNVNTQRYNWIASGQYWQS